MTAARDALLDRYAAAQTEMAAASQEVRSLAETECHLAAVARANRAYAELLAAEEALDDYDYDGEMAAFHANLLRRITEAA